MKKRKKWPFAVAVLVLAAVAAKLVQIIVIRLPEAQLFWTGIRFRIPFRRRL